VRAGWLYGIVQFYVRQFGSPDDFLLLLDLQRVPSVQVMQVLLHDHIAPTRERRIFLSDDRGIDSSLFHGVLRPINETDQVSIIEEIEAVHFVMRRSRTP